MSKGKYIRQYLDSGYILFPVKGKDKNLPMEWEKTEQNVFLGEKDFPNNFGICLQEDDLVIDVDPRNFIKGDKPHQRLAKDIGWGFPTMIIETGGGGLHIYLKKPITYKVRKKHPDYSGIDFLTKGCFVVGAGSSHPDTKKIYKLVRGNLGKPAPAPMALLERLHITEKDFKKLNTLEEYIDDQQTVQRFEHWLTRAEVAVSGRGGDQTTFKVACQGRRFGLSPDKTLELMLEWNKKCDPPWEEEELKYKIHNAYEYNNEPMGAKSPHADFEAIDETKGKKEVVKKIVWQRSKSGALLNTSIHNICNFFTCNPVSKELHGLLRYNLFTKNIEFSRRPTWLDPEEPITPWDETDAILCRKHFSSKFCFQLQKNMIHEAALAVSVENSYHPVKDYLNKLKWDGVPRVKNWLATYLGAKDSHYESEVGKLLLVASVARIFNAGCKFEYLVVLEGRQGVGKTRACAILGGEWYGDIVLNVHDKDTVDAMRLKWIIEVSEMEMSKRTDVQAMKSFLSRQVDTVRLAYARGAKDFPRQQIFIGTINPDTEGYLKDVENRRFFPVVVKSIDQEKLIADRDQLWAEAVLLYKTQDNTADELYLKDVEASRLATIEVDKRRSRDPWIDRVSDWLNDPEVERDVVSGADVYHFGIGGDIKDYDRTKQSRVSGIMRDLGWGKSKVHRIDGKVIRGFRKPTYTEEDL